MATGDINERLEELRRETDALREALAAEIGARRACDFQLEALRDAIAEVVSPRNPNAVALVEARLLNDMQALADLHRALFDRIANEIEPRLRRTEQRSQQGNAETQTEPLLVQSPPLASAGQWLDTPGPGPAAAAAAANDRPSTGAAAASASAAAAPDDDQQRHWRAGKWHRGPIPDAPPNDSWCGRWVTDPRTLARVWVEEGNIGHYNPWPGVDEVD